MKFTWKNGKPITWQVTVHNRTLRPKAGYIETDDQEAIALLLKNGYQSADEAVLTERSVREHQLPQAPARRRAGGVKP